MGKFILAAIRNIDIIIYKKPFYMEKKVNITVILLFLLMIGSGVAIAIFGDYHIPGIQFSFIILISLGAGFGATFLTGKISGEGKFGFITIKSASGGLLIWLITLSSYIYFFQPDKHVEHNASVTEKVKKTDELNIFVLKSGDHEYTNTILLTFLNNLRDSLEHTKYYFDVPPVLSGIDDDYKNEKTKKDFKTKIENILLRHQFSKYEYIVTIGTSASKAFADFRTENPEKTRGFKHIFLGVTNPYRAGIIGSMSSSRMDEDHMNTAGVAYCGNYQEVPRILNSLYPNDTIYYIYNSNIIEDGHFANDFVGQPLVTSRKFKIIQLEGRDPLPKDFKTSNAVYYSWSTFDDFFDKNQDLLNRVKIVSPNPIHAKHGIVPFVVGTDEKEIGLFGARVLLKNLLDNIPLGEIDIYIPEWKTYVNKICAANHQIPIEIINNCDKKY